MPFKNVISWFEIAANDLDRAVKFYEKIFDTQLIPFVTPGLKMRMFPLEDMTTGVGGALVNSSDFHKGSASDGPLIYLNGNPDVQIILDRVIEAGDQVLVPKTEISPEYGYMGVFLDSEGNRIALHSVPSA